MLVTGRAYGKTGQGNRCGRMFRARGGVRRLVDHDSGRGGGMVYADGSNPSVRKDIGVRLPSPALF